MKKIYFLLLLFIFTSCGNFLEEYSRDLKYCKTAEDLDKLMIGEAFPDYKLYISISSYSTMSELTSESAGSGMLFPWIHVMDDDSQQFLLGSVSSDQSTPSYMLSGFHNWRPNPCIDINNKTWVDVNWRKIYKRIGAINSIIYQGEELLKDATTDKELLQHVLGEAYFLRGCYYFTLHNVYGSPYRKATASTDESVPLKISEKVEDNYFSRAKNQTVLDQIIKDLNSAAKYLGNYNPTTKIRVGIGAVKALQSRVYLYVEQYDLAAATAAEVEAMNYQLTDLNAYEPNTNFTFRSSTETILTMGSNDIPLLFINDSLSSWNQNNACNFRASNELVDCYQTNDLRLSAFFKRTAKTKSFIPAKYRSWEGSYNADPEQVSCLYLFRLSEVILNRAEALAMQGNDNDARTELQKLRAKRFANANIADLPQSNEALVKFIREERRRELCFEGHRWFDLRRYAVNSKYPLSEDFTIRHACYSYNSESSINIQTGYYELKSFSQDAPCWQVPIPDYAIEFNRGALKNPIRNERTVISL